MLRTDKPYAKIEMRSSWPSLNRHHMIPTQAHQAARLSRWWAQAIEVGESLNIKDQEALIISRPEAHAADMTMQGLCARGRPAMPLQPSQRMATITDSNLEKECQNNPSDHQ